MTSLGLVLQDMRLLTIIMTAISCAVICLPLPLFAATAIEIGDSASVNGLVLRFPAYQYYVCPGCVPRPGVNSKSPQVLLAMGTSAALFVQNDTINLGGLVATLDTIQLDSLRISVSVMALLTVKPRSKTIGSVDLVGYGTIDTACRLTFQLIPEGVMVFNSTPAPEGYIDTITTFVQDAYLPFHDFRYIERWSFAGYTDYVRYEDANQPQHPPTFFARSLHVRLDTRVNQPARHFDQKSSSRSFHQNNQQGELLPFFDLRGRTMTSPNAIVASHVPKPVCNPFPSIVHANGHVYLVISAHMAIPAK